MEIRKIITDKQDCLALLLEADPSERMIGGCLERGDLFVSSKIFLSRITRSRSWKTGSI